MIMDTLPVILSDLEAPRDQMTSVVADGDVGVSSSALVCTEPQLPAKKATRQWAAWTRQEEESFFTALRQVGKNFEKITRRVQSKNKDQVRHYYYRLVRRMNKLLGPEFCLDSKNSKDTNAAMLRWWSLLEKYSCKASKLHLKPRRFKLFVEALENQLMKDRKKNMRKRPVGENPSPLPPNSVAFYDRQTTNDPRMVKLVFMDSQSMDKLSCGKGQISRNFNIGTFRNSKGQSSSLKPTRQKRKQGIASSTAYKRWEKAAIAGMSLVADAAEHLERAGTSVDVQQKRTFSGLEALSHAESTVPQSSFPEADYGEVIAHASVKLKLQLFPIDEVTRRTLETDKHNPFLELTLSTRKKISSVIEHLNKKWGSSSIAEGSLALFPYCAQRENTLGCQCWTQDSAATAAEVYSAIGSPSIFRLRYGWFSDKEFEQSLPSNQHLSREKIWNKVVRVTSEVSRDRMQTKDSSFNIENFRDCAYVDGPPASSNLNAADNVIGQEFLMPAANVGWCTSNPGNHVDTECMRPNMDAITGVEWADSLTNISIGDLLSDIPPDADNSFSVSHHNHNDLYQIPFSCDSFDAAIAAHLIKHQKPAAPSSEPSPSFSLWDAEETCDAFSFQSRLISSPPLVEEPKIEKHTIVANSYTEQPAEDNARDASPLTDIYWPESLGPLDLELPSCKYQGSELILSDSLSGLNRLIANSLDAFQNISFLSGQEKLISNT